MAPKDLITTMIFSVAGYFCWLRWDEGGILFWTSLGVTGFFGIQTLGVFYKMFTGKEP
jgi:hypothetical protein